MQRSWLLAVVLSLLLCGSASWSKDAARQFQKAIVINVEKFQPTLPYRNRRSDSPPPPSEFDFDVSLRLQCSIYVGHYQTAIEYLPGEVARDRSVEVSIAGHVMYLKLQDGHEMKLEVIRHYKDRDSPCKLEH